MRLKYSSARGILLNAALSHFRRQIGQRSCSIEGRIILGHQSKTEIQINLGATRLYSSNFAHALLFGPFAPMSTPLQKTFAAPRDRPSSLSVSTRTQNSQNFILPRHISPGRRNYIAPRQCCLPHFPGSYDHEPLPRDTAAAHEGHYPLEYHPHSRRDRERARFGGRPHSGSRFRSAM
jgi:hypothetical protein